MLIAIVPAPFPKFLIVLCIHDASLTTQCRDLLPDYPYDAAVRDHGLSAPLALLNRAPVRLQDVASLLERFIVDCPVSVREELHAHRTSCCGAGCSVLRLLASRPPNRKGVVTRCLALNLVFNACLPLRPASGVPSGRTSTVLAPFQK